MIISKDRVTTEDVSDWRGLHLLHFQGSTCSQKVRLILGELDQEWVSHPVNLMTHQNATPWFLGINPRGVVPVLVHDGVVHVESNDIIAYLDSCFAAPGKSYFFEAESDLAQEAQGLLDLEDSLHCDLRVLTIQFGPLSLKSEKQLEAQESNGAYDEKRDHEIRWWRERASNGLDPKEIKLAVGRFHDALTQLNSRLATRTWLMGENISIVDICWYVNLQRLVRLGYPLPLHGQLHSLFERLGSRKAFKVDAQHPGSRMASAVFRMIRLRNTLTRNRIAQYL